MKTVLFLCGGRSEEHEISLISAKCLLEAIDRKKWQPIVVAVDKEGRWFFYDNDKFYEGNAIADQITISKKGKRASILPFLNDQGRGALVVEGKEVPFDVVFPIIHGQFGEDGTLQGLFDLAGFSYVGSGCESSAVCMDKVLTKILCEQADLAVSDFVWVGDVNEVPLLDNAIEALGFPLFIKPSRQGSSVGVSKVTKKSDLASAVTKALKFDSKCLIEKGIVGREIECAVLGSSREAKASIPGEIIVKPSVGWYSYEAKYLLPDAADTVVPAELTSEEVKKIQEFALKVFCLLECEGLARVDMFLETATGDIYLNEVNTLPGFTPISMYPKMWQASGLTYSSLIDELIVLALQRKGKNA